MRALRGGAVAMAVSLCASPALAHGFGGAGWLHPLTGPDHMLAMVLVGAWSAQLGGRALWIVPSAFVLAMGAGAAAAIAGPVMPYSEIAIALSIAALGISIALGRSVATPLAAAATLAFGWSHGVAHGIEAPFAAPAAELAGYIAGFLVTTAGLHVAGLVGGALLLETDHGASKLRLAGTASALAGVAILAAAA